MGLKLRLLIKVMDEWHETLSVSNSPEYVHIKVPFGRSTNVRTPHPVSAVIKSYTWNSMMPNALINKRNTWSGTFKLFWVTRLMQAFEQWQLLLPTNSLMYLCTFPSNLKDKNIRTLVNSGQMFVEQRSEFIIDLPWSASFCQSLIFSYRQLLTLTSFWVQAIIYWKEI